MMPMQFSIERASAPDKQAIIRVLTPWNMQHIPSPEMAEIDFNCFFVARHQGEIIGVSGYQLLREGLGKTTLLAVLPHLQGSGLGRALQDVRLEAMYAAGVTTVRTNADRPETIIWYKKHYGYVACGKEKKVASFGHRRIDHWTTLELDLQRYVAEKDQKARNKKRYLEDNAPHPLSPYPALIINVCLTGMIPSKAMNRFVPITIDEIVEDAVRVYDAGARIVHLHARDRDGRPTYQARWYEDIIIAIRRERPALLCCVSTSGRTFNELEQRAEVLYLTGAAQPDMASLTLGSLNFLEGPSSNSLTMIQALADIMKEQQIKPELEVFDSGMINLAHYLKRHELITGTAYFNILLGNLNTAPATIGQLAHLYAQLPSNSVWAAGGLGRFQLPVNTAAIVAGGHVRVGLEDALHYDYEHSRPAHNRGLVERVVRLAGELQRTIASPIQTRTLLGLKPPPAR